MLYNRIGNYKVFAGYRTKRVGFIGDGASNLLAPSPF